MIMGVTEICLFGPYVRETQEASGDAEGRDRVTAPFQISKNCHYKYAGTNEKESCPGWSHRGHDN